MVLSDPTRCVCLFCVHALFCEQRAALRLEEKRVLEELERRQEEVRAMTHELDDISHDVEEVRLIDYFDLWRSLDRVYFFGTCLFYSLKTLFFLVTYVACRCGHGREFEGNELL